MPAIDLWTSTDGGALLVAAVLLPSVGLLLGLLLGGRWPQRGFRLRCAQVSARSGISRQWRPYLPC